MNKTSIGILSFFALMILTTACKKEYSCKCTGSAMGFSADTSISLGKTTKKDAKNQCSNFETNYKTAASIGAALLGLSIDVNCGIE